MISVFFLEFFFMNGITSNIISFYSWMYICCDRWSNWPRKCNSVCQSFGNIHTKRSWRTKRPCNTLWSCVSSIGCYIASGFYSWGSHYDCTSVFFEVTECPTAIFYSAKLRLPIIVKYSIDRLQELFKIIFAFWLLIGHSYFFRLESN